MLKNRFAWPGNGRLMRAPVLTALAVLLLASPFIHSFDQARFLVLLGISMAGMGWLGGMSARLLRLEVLIASPALFTRILLGQVALVVMWLLLSPLTLLWSRGLGLSHGLPLVIMGLMAGTLWWRRGQLSTWKHAASHVDGAWLLIALLATMVLLKAGTHYSLRAGALGLDTHQHIAFALDQFTAGYPKLSAGHTLWLEKYPKMLHVLAALWAWPGFGLHIGPFLKIQPVLQATLAIFAIAEVVLLWIRQRQVSVPMSRAWAVMVVVVLGYCILRGTSFLYPVDDLNSTGRLAAISTLLFPVLCAMLCWLEPAKSGRPWVLAWLSLPLAGAMAAKLNPSLAIAFVSFAVPAWMLLMLPLWFRVDGLRGKLGLPLLGLLAGGVPGVLLLVTDPYYLQLLAEASPVVRRFVEQTLGLRLLVAPVELGRSSAEVVERLVQVLPWELWYGPQPSMGGQYLPDSQQVVAHTLLPLTRPLAVFTFLVGMAMMTIAPASIRSRRAFGLLVIAQFALAVAVAVALRVSNITTLTLGHDTLEASLLSTYTQRYIGLLTMYAVFLQWILMLAILVMAVDAGLQWRMPRVLQGRTTDLVSRCAMAVAALAVVASFISIDIKGVTPADQGWTFPINESDVRAFQAAERALPDDAVVLAPAYAIVLNGREDWVLPSMYVTPYLPFAHRDYLFNVRLGSGYGFFAKDLRSMFCRSQVQQTREILRRAGVTHLLVHRWEGQGDERALDGQYCLTGYRQLGAAGKPVATGPDGLVFYRLDP